MIKIVDKKKYDTDKAEYICGISNGYHESDFRFRDRDLYRTNRGNWFIHHAGGALTDMAQTHGSSRSWGEDIQPIVDVDAYEFLVKCSSVDARKAIDQYFSGSFQDA